MPRRRVFRIISSMDSNELATVQASWALVSEPREDPSLQRRLALLLDGNHDRAGSLLDVTARLLPHLASATALQERVRHLADDSRMTMPLPSRSEVAALTEAISDTLRGSTRRTELAWQRAWDLVEQCVALDHLAPFGVGPTARPNDVARPAENASADRWTP